MGGIALRPLLCRVILGELCHKRFQRLLESVTNIQLAFHVCGVAAGGVRILSIHNKSLVPTKYVTCDRWRASLTCEMSFPLNINRFRARRQIVSTRYQAGLFTTFGSEGL